MSGNLESQGRNLEVGTESGTLKESHSLAWPPGLLSHLSRTTQALLPREHCPHWVPQTCAQASLMEAIPRLMFPPGSQLSLLCVQLTKPNTSLNWALAPGGDKAEEDPGRRRLHPVPGSWNKEGFPA